MLAAKRRVGVGREEILSVSFWNSDSKDKFSSSCAGKSMIKTFGKDDLNCSVISFEGVLISESGVAVILILFSVRWLMISEQRVRAEASNQMEHSE